MSCTFLSMIILQRLGNVKIQFYHCLYVPQDTKEKYKCYAYYITSQYTISLSVLGHTDLFFNGLKVNPKIIVQDKTITYHIMKWKFENQ